MIIKNYWKDYYKPHNSCVIVIIDLVEEKWILLIGVKIMFKLERFKIFANLCVKCG